MKSIKLLCCVFFMVLLFVACGQEEVPTTTTTTEPVTVRPETTVATTVAPTTTVATEASTRKVKYGDYKLTTNTDNPFVDAVVQKYGISREGLVCVYSPDGREGNYVWQFNGSKDENGKYIRTAETLKYVYAVSADYQTVSRTGGKIGNDGCTLKDGMTVFLLTQKVLLPNLQNEMQKG